MPKTQYHDGTDWNDVSDIFMFVPDAFDATLDDPAVWAAIQGKVTTQNSDPSAAAHPVQRAPVGDRPGTWVPVNPASLAAAPGAADPAVKFRKWLNPDPPVVVPPGALHIVIKSMAASVYVSTKVTVVVTATNSNATRPMTVNLVAAGVTGYSGAQTIPANTTKDLTFTFIAPAAAVAALTVTANGTSAAGTGSASAPVSAAKVLKVLAKPTPKTITLTASATTAELYAKNSGTTFTKQTTNHEHDLNQGKFTGGGTATTGVRMSFLGIPSTATAAIPAGVVPKSIVVTVTRTTSGGVSGAVPTHLRASGLGPSIPASLGAGTAAALKQIGAVVIQNVSRGEAQAFTFTDAALMAAWAAKQVHGFILGAPTLGTAEYANYESSVKIVVNY